MERILLIVLRNAPKRLNRSDSRNTRFLEVIIPGSLNCFRRRLYLFIFQGDGNIPYSVNENHAHHSAQVIIILFVEKKKKEN